MNKILVRKNDDGIRAGGKPDECFFCKQKVGMPHLDTCTCLLRKARVKITVELDAFVPNYDKEDIEYLLTYKYHVMKSLTKQIVDQMENDILEPKVKVKKIYDKLKRGI